ncbi:MAG: hypothetical protein CVV39_01990 [Planctomycetes bacterium HGW-Planctomycetes-1]|nr:MAG: hypothetical protein CVV39_01990 [Planctomycetes bacterium HGW-Planctomycetes-1]
MNARATHWQPADLSGVKTMIENRQLIYLYCVADTEPKMKQIEDCGNDLYSVCHNDLYAVVGKVDQQEFGEEGLKRNMADMEWIKAKAGMHEKIIERVMADTDVIPFKFGTLFNADASLKAMLEQYGQEFKAILRKLAYKQEWGLKIYYNPEKLKANLGNDDAEILKIEDEIKSSSAGKSYFLKKKKDELLEKTLNEKINECGQESFELLKELSFEARINRLLPREVTEREDEMVLNSAFLVDKDEVGDFRNMVDTLKMHYEGKGFYIDCTGPWPPYNFCGLSSRKGQNE